MSDDPALAVQARVVLDQVDQFGYVLARDGTPPASLWGHIVAQLTDGVPAPDSVHQIVLGGGLGGLSVEVDND